MADWAADVPGEKFNWILNNWKKEQNNPADLAEMDNFVKRIFQEYKKSKIPAIS